MTTEKVAPSVQEALLASVCKLPTEEFLAGPGGYTSREFEGRQFVSEEEYEYVSAFTYCALERLDRALAEAERHGISRATMEEVMRHER